MRRTAMVRVSRWTGLVVAGLVAVAAAHALCGETKGDKPAKPRGRLPAYFKEVVTQEQTEKIYAIQKEFEPKISQLRQELDALTKARDEQIRNVLTEEQKKKIDELIAAAKSKQRKDTETKKETKKATKKATKSKPTGPEAKSESPEPAK